LAALVWFLFPRSDTRPVAQNVGEVAVAASALLRSRAQSLVNNLQPRVLNPVQRGAARAQHVAVAAFPLLRSTAQSFVNNLWPLVRNLVQRSAARAQHVAVAAFALLRSTAQSFVNNLRPLAHNLMRRRAARAQHQVQGPLEPPPLPGGAPADAAAADS